MVTTKDSPTVRVQVFSTVYCGYCRSAENLLRARGIPFEVVDVTDDPETRASLVERAHGRRTVPVIFIDGNDVGGYQELARLAARGGLEHLTDRTRAA
ncbi:MAG TPA: glutaredoxin domain-containing protein [Polyangia bacterium]|jgi:glutaredoxin 3